MAKMRKLLKHALIALSIFHIGASQVSAHELPDNVPSTEPGNSTTPWQSHLLLPRQKKIYGNLRLLPLGDSITEGYGSGDGSGYRKQLRDKLAAVIQTVDFIGSRSGGNFPDNQHEGFGGYKIQQIRDAMRADGILDRKPNVVLVHAGTNDLWHGNSDDIAQAPARLSGLLDDIYCRNSKTVVVLARLVGNSNVQSRNDKFNRKVIQICSQRVKAGFRCKVVDMSPIRGTDTSDGVHPTDAGYAKMAQRWYDAVYNIPPNWIEDASGSAPGSAVACQRDKLYWSRALNGNQIAAGARVPGDTGVEPAGAVPTFTAAWTDRGRIAGGVSRSGSFVKFADIDGDGRDDYTWIDPATGSVRVWLNKGVGSWQALNNENPVALGVNGYGWNVFLADLDGDKRADYIYIRDNVIETYRNLGPYGTTYNWDRPIKITLPGGNVNQQSITFGDINGDGKADIVRKNADGSWDFFILNGSGGIVNQQTIRGEIPWYKDDPKLQMADIDGDGYDDFVWINSAGRVIVTLNVRGGPRALKKTVPVFVSDRQNDACIRDSDFGEGVSGRVADIDGDGKVDFVKIYSDNGAADLELQTGTLSRTGGPAGGADFGLTGIGAAVRMADLDGDGLDDYISIAADTSAIGYLNKGQSGNGWNWWPMNGGKLIALGHGGAKRHQIHLADINGDKRADYLVVDEADSSVIAYLNGGVSANGEINWQPKGKIALGVKKPGVGLRFADLDGNGRADFIWVDEDGKASVYLNTGDGDSVIWTAVNDFKPIANGVGGKQAEVQFADIDGDGRADYLRVYPDNGAVDVWYSDGKFGDGWYWTSGGRIADGIGYPGKAVRFARLTSTGRADYLGVTESNGALVGYFNGCLAARRRSLDTRQTCAAPDQPVGYPMCTKDYQRFCEIADCNDPDTLSKRGNQTLEHRQHDLGGDDLLERRSGKGGNARPLQVYGLSIAFVIWSLIYPDRTTFLNGTPRGSSHNLMYTGATSCADTRIRFSSADVPAPGTGIQNPLPAAWATGVQLDHPVDLQIIARFLQFAVTGEFGSLRTTLPLIPETTLTQTWFDPNGVPRSNNQPYGEIGDLIMHSLGDSADFQNFIPLRADLNRMKGSLFGSLIPYDVDRFTTLIKNADAGSNDDYEHVTALFHEFFGVFNYINEPDFTVRYNNVMTAIRNAWAYLDSRNFRWRGILALWDQFHPMYFQAVVDRSSNWASDALNVIALEFGDRDDFAARELLSLIGVFLEQLEDLHFGNIRPS